MLSVVALTKTPKCSLIGKEKRVEINSIRRNVIGTKFAAPVVFLDVSTIKLTLNVNRNKLARCPTVYF